MTPLAQLLGGEAAAAAWMNSRVHQLVIWHRLDPLAALELVEHAVADHDPAILAEPGQVWARRPEADEELPVVLYVTHRLSSEHMVAEDGGFTGTGVIPLAALHSYTLDHWHRS
ncbi:hypothetical protein ACWF95_33965 [Streptomyces vinaceus]